MHRGFSLVELSIVLVILGLLVGGILAGQSLIRASELRAVSTEQARHVTAVHAFRDKYFALPGDMANATAFWGRMQNVADCQNRTGASVLTTGSCDGNADGRINGAAASQNGESMHFWRQLSLAGLVEGAYTGIAGAGGIDAGDAGNSPSSKANGALWSVGNLGSYPGNTDNYAYESGNMLRLGKFVAAGWPYGTFLKPEELWNIDTKMDDGMPGTGKLLAAVRTTCANATSVTDYASTYQLGSSATVCLPLFIKQF